MAQFEVRPEQVVRNGFSKYCRYTCGPCLWADVLKDPSVLLKVKDSHKAKDQKINICKSSKSMQILMYY